MAVYRVYADSRKLSRGEWLEARRAGIGGSDAGAIMGVSPYKGPFSVWADKVSPEGEPPDSEAMRQGRDLEEYVAQRFAEKTGKKVRREYGMLQSLEHPHMLANLDRRIVGERAGLECKTSRDIYMRRYRDGDFPMEYYCQCLHYLAVTGWDAWYLAVLVYGTDLLVFKICREEAQGDIAALVAAEERFWLDYMEGGSIPPPDALRTTGEAMGRVWSEGGGRPLDADEEAEDVIGQLIDAKARRRALDEEIRGLENAIKARMQEAEELRSTQALVTWRPQKTRRISERLIRELYPEVDLDNIRETTETRRFGIRTEEEE